MKKLILLFAILSVNQVIAQAPFLWTEWAYSENVLDIRSDAQHIYVATNYGTVKIQKSNYNNKSYYTKLSSDYNLIENYIFNIAIDNSGNIIIGNYNSIHKYDGTTWQNFIAGQNGVPNFGLGYLYTDSIGNIWLGSQSTYLHKFNGTTWTTYNNSNTNNHLGNSINKIHYHQGKMYFCTEYNGVAWFDGSNWGSYKTSNSGIHSDSYVDDIAFDATGNMWVITQAGLSKYDGTNWTLYTNSNVPQFPDNNFKSLAFYNNKLYLTISQELFEYDGSNWTSLGYNGGTVMHVDNTSNLLILGSYNYEGIKIYNGSNFTSVSLSNSDLKSHVLSGVAIDPVNNKKYISGLYVSTFDGVTWGDLGTNNVPYNFHNSTLRVKNGKVWVGSSVNWNMQNPGLAIYENNNWLQICPPNLSYLYFTDLELDNNNNAWIAAPNNGLYKYNGNTFTEYNTSNSTLPYNNVSKLKFDNSGNLWIASGKFLIKFNGSTFALVDSVNFGTFWWSLSNNINDIDIAPAGNIYLATGVGLCIYKPSDGTWINYKTSNSSIPSNDINLVKVNAMGDVWITCTGTNNNFYITRFRGGNWVGVSKTTCPMDALPTDMQLDNYGNLWFVSSNANRGGLYKLADTTYIYSSVPTIYQNTTFAVFPNPNNGYFTIQSDKESAFELMDITGRIINTYRVYGRLDVSENLPEGMYFVRDIENGVSQKIVIK